MFALLAAGAALSAGIGAYGANKAAKQQREGIERGMEYQRPYANAGKQYLELMGNMYGLNGKEGEALDTYKRSPQYQLLQDVIAQSTEDVKGAHAASGTLASGSFGKDLSSYNAKLTLQDYYNYLNGIQNGINTGIGATNQMTQGEMGIGNARASGTMGMTNAIQGGIQNMMGIYGKSQGMSAGGSYPLQYDPTWGNTQTMRFM